MKKVKILALIAALVAAILIYFFFNAISQSGSRNNIGVIVAAVDIPANTSITEEMITVKELPAIALVTGAIRDNSVVLGKMNKADIYAGEQIVERNLIMPGEAGGGTLAYAIQPGMRAITISVDTTTGLSGMLKPGDKVDIVGEFEYQGASYTSLVAENIKILAVDAVMGNNGLPAYTTVTLEATQRQSMELSMAVYRGNLRTILRSPLDDKKNNLPNLTLDNVMTN